MKDFCELYYDLDATNSTNEKVRALAHYISHGESGDKLWVLALLSGRRPKRTIATNRLKEWAAELAGIEPWLFDECYDVVGDLAETIALLLPQTESVLSMSLSQAMDLLHEMKYLEDEDKKQHITRLWQQMSSSERFVFNKLITGGFRVGVSQKIVAKALSKATDIHEDAVSHRLMGDWNPLSTTFEALLLEENINDELSKPYPFYLAYALEDEPETLGREEEWVAEYKWDGIRGQLIHRRGQLFLWSRGEELVTDKYPELHALRFVLPDDVVIDAEILAFQEGKPLPFQSLQKRIGRQKVSARLMQEIPVVLMAYDVLEWQGRDVRHMPLQLRKEWLHSLEGLHPQLQISQPVQFTDWESLRQIRIEAPALGAEGLMLKLLSSPYETGRKRGGWWKWKVEPLRVDAVMIYAQKGHGRRANLYTDFTFAVWNDGALVPFAKAYSGLTDKELREVDAFVNANTIEKFGPVRSVKPELVFEIAFEGIGFSPRHKSGVALRFPRIALWRKDKKPAEADTLDSLKKLIRN